MQQNESLKRGNILKAGYLRVKITKTRKHGFSLLGPRVVKHFVELVRCADDLAPAVLAYKKVSRVRLLPFDPLFL